ncbi:efflux RND transporter periplasmic adaptor subunit [Spongiivirga citrea]|uniref:Efflux RND transporter periplasmic adaptor subunit n=1 Tax=Spongiivirga citrea TaxID=1481457 RepID=A0A6M0CG46_9FLAO|nr:efflux RND transporter periplasmic adaptor subunit [Spongiivirga citrea]NER16811.1 efflux RND transporter periplasmic adaptor subunit [Spongiivirga citrea]
MKTYRYIITLSILTLLAWSCSSDEKKNRSDDTPAVAVAVASVELDTSAPTLNVSGKVQAINSATLSTRIMGSVNEVYVNIGDKVKKGQLLVSINSDDLRAKQAQINAKISEANASFINAEKDYNRYKILFSESSATQKELDNMNTNFEMAKARLETAQQMRNELETQFSYTDIRAPFNGVVTNKSIKSGAMATMATPLVTIEAPEKLEVSAMVPESEISKINTGMDVDVLIKSINQTLKGRVTQVSPSANETGGQYAIKVSLDDSKVPVLSGMYATVRFPIEPSMSSQRISIPHTAIIRKGELSGVYTISESNKALLRWLRLGKDLGDHVEVLSGLKAGEYYIVSAEGKLFNRAKVVVK